MEATLKNSICNPNISAALQLTARPNWLMAFALLIPCLASAAGWEIDPIRVELSAKQPTTAVTVKNESDQPTTIQIQAVSWSQKNGEDIYRSTSELIVSPPIVTIAAHGEQVLRVGLRHKVNNAVESAYRINLQELPSPPTPEFSGVKVALRIGLPVFVQSKAGKTAPKTAWTAVRQAPGVLKISLNNQGNTHIQVSDFSVYAKGHEAAIASESGTNYVLAGQTHEWLLKTNAAEQINDGRLHLKAYTDAAIIETELVLDQP
jgi:fimbrial chaperone protein